MEVVVAGVIEVKQANDLVPVLLAVEVAHLDARLEVVVEGLVALLQGATLDVRNLEDGLIDCGGGEPLVDSCQSIGQYIGQEHIAVGI